MKKTLGIKIAALILCFALLLSFSVLLATALEPTEEPIAEITVPETVIAEEAPADEPAAEEAPVADPEEAPAEEAEPADEPTIGEVTTEVPDETDEPIETEKSVVIMLYKQDRTLVQTITLTDPEIVSQIEEAWNAVNDDMLSAVDGELYRTTSDYLCRVYLNGFAPYVDYDFLSDEDRAALSSIVYRPDIDIDRFNFCADSEVWFLLSGQMYGMGTVTSLINPFVTPYLD